MKNIYRIIVSDIKRISVNVVAMIVIMGLTVIPCLYAWFNILSNWDPYGQEATSNLQVAVASLDQGIIIGNYQLNVGDIIISHLKENKTIGWVFTETEEEAVDGVYAGKYYAALVIDEEFSSNMISFLGGDIENPVITYYENDKKNAIAPKITGKVKTAIEREVDHAFVGTMAETLLNAGEYFATMDEEGNITGEGIAKLERLDSDLKGLIALLDSYIALSDSTESISEAGKAITDTASSVTKVAEEMAVSAQISAREAKNDIQDGKNKADSKLSEINDKLLEADNGLNRINEKIARLDIEDVKSIHQLRETITTLKAEWGTADDGKGIYYHILKIKTGFEDVDSAIADKAKEVDGLINGLDADVDALDVATAQGQEQYNKAKERLTGDVALCLNDTNNIRQQYTKVISPLEQNAIDTTSKSVAEIEKLLNYKATSIDLVVDNLESYAGLMDQSKDSLVKSRDEAVAMEGELAALITDIKSVGQNEAYQKFMELLRSDPEFLADFISSPVAISDDYIYPIENNGSMTAPFYIVLSIWVGALIMSTILKTTIKTTTGMDNLKNWQCFFGRFFLTFVIGQIQTLITVLGAFLFVGIQCQHHFLFWLACSWTSFVYALLLYSFTYSFGNMGEALSVILMVIQVAGAGGTFPIEVLPKVFQALYRFMPFNYSMNALRECIGGLYKNTYRDCMLILLIYVVVAIFIGVVLYHPFKTLNEKIEKSKEKSGILI